MKVLNRSLLPLLMAAAFLLHPAGRVQADEAVVNAPAVALPNIHGKSLTTPVGWGAAFGSAFVGIGGTSPAPYADRADGGMAFGVGLGNPVKQVGLQVSANVLDLSEFDLFSLSAFLHRYIGSSTSVAIGGENMLISDEAQSDGSASYYVVVSRCLARGNTLLNRRTMTSKLHYSIGVGNGRFSKKSPLDEARGKGSRGTAVFGNVSYELFDAFNVVADWNGVNLNAGAAKTFLINDTTPVSLTLGLADLTDYSGDGVRLIGGLGVGFLF